MNADCHYGDHQWRGGGICIACGTRLRCYCGAFVREDGIEEHLKKCPVTLAAEQAEYDELHSHLLSEAMA